MKWNKIFYSKGKEWMRTVIVVGIILVQILAACSQEQSTHRDAEATDRATPRPSAQQLAKYVAPRTKPGGEPVKKATRDTALDVGNKTTHQTLISLSKARFALDKHDKQEALTYLRRVQQNVPSLNLADKRKAPMVIALTYLSHGTMTTLYVPANHGEKPFADVERIGKQLRVAEIVPSEYSLLRYQPSFKMAVAKKQLRQATSHLTNPDIDDAASAATKATHSLDMFSRSLVGSSYEAAPETMLGLHVELSSVFIKQGWVALARNAYGNAHDAYEVYAMKPEHQNTAQGYADALAVAEKALEVHDPSPLKHVSTAIDGLMNKLVE